MKRSYLLFIPICCFLVSCATLTQLSSFINCNYEFKNLSNPAISGVSLNNVSDLNNLDALSLLKLSTGIVAGNLPLSTTVNIKVVNPNATTAQIEGLEWALDFNNANILTGATNSPVSIAPNGGSTIIPFNVEMNLMDIMKGETKTEIFNMVNSMLNLGDSNSKMSLRVRPTIKVGGQIVHTGYITVHKKI